MTKEEVFFKLKDVLIAEFGLDPEDITQDALIFQELGLDSIDAVDLIVKMKDCIPGKINAEAFKQVKTVQDIVDVLYPLTKGLKETVSA
ncbi:MAG: phosphopantetheine-binding protein [Spirochaetaceae bacterium]|jgi:acyl carrier protein|nr:phosphopantetheine-binding protein [Spirochaetaceae bacterium]